MWLCVNLCLNIQLSFALKYSTWRHNHLYHMLHLLLCSHQAGDPLPSVLQCTILCVCTHTHTRTVSPTLPAYMGQADTLTQTHLPLTSTPCPSASYTITYVHISQPYMGKELCVAQMYDVWGCICEFAWNI